MGEDWNSLFTETTHALLFAWIARAVIQQAGPQRGEGVLRLAVRRYGEQRGRRMAQRARRDGMDLGMPAYLAYGEWRSATGLGQQELSQPGQDARLVVLRCPWNEAWNQDGLGVFGRLYCREIDRALLRGFNPALSLEVRSTLSNDGLPCDFLFRGGALSPLPQPHHATVQPWGYHAGHLYAALCAVLNQELGEAGLRAARDGLRELESRCGPGAARVVLAYLDADFDAV